MSEVYIFRPYPDDPEYTAYRFKVCKIEGGTPTLEDSSSTLCLMNGASSYEKKHAFVRRSHGQPAVTLDDFIIKAASEAVRAKLTNVIVLEEPKIEAGGLAGYMTYFMC